MTVSEIVRQNKKISIIIPMFNSINTLETTMDSIFSQTYTDWEVIIVDDMSTDGSKEYAESLAHKDDRIKAFQMEENSGPGAATKLGFENANGGIIAFIDADDIWVPDKLEKQLAFMEKNNYAFCCTHYDQIDGLGNSRNRIIKCKEKADYNVVLRSCPVGSSTVMITSNLLKQVEIPIIRKNNDYSLWLQILKIYPYIYGMDAIMMHYRVWPNSISYNKFKKVSFFWKVYREYEKFSVPKSLLLLLEWTMLKIFRIK